MKSVIIKLKEQYQKHRQILLYLFFGVCTTAINTICYGVLYECISMGNIASTIIGWLVAVIFAFITNKVFVFESQQAKMSQRLGEIVSFFGCRIMTGILDVIVMVIAVDYLKWNSIIWKLISNIIVTVINYAASKFIVFKNNGKG